MITPPTLIESAFGLRGSELTTTPDLDPVLWHQAIQRLIHGLHENKVIYSERWYCLAQFSDYIVETDRVTFTVTTLWWPNNALKETWKGSFIQRYTRFSPHSWGAYYTLLKVWPEPERVRLFEKYALAGNLRAAQNLTGGDDK